MFLTVLWKVIEIQMKIYSTIFASFALVVCFVIPIQAQQPSGIPASSISPPSAGAATFKIAVIEMEAFYNPEKGITRLIRAIEGMDQEFEPIKKELQDMRRRYQALTDELAKGNPSIDSKALKEKTFRADSLQRELRNKAEDAEQAFQKRLRQVIDPIEDDLQKAIASFAAQRGIALVIDLTSAQDVIIYAAESVNVTRDFIDEYNRRALPSSPHEKRPGN